MRKNEYTIAELVPLVEQWADDKDLIKPQNADNQYLKFLEELGETARFLLLKNASDEKLESKGLTREQVEAEIKDGFGDIAVTVIIYYKQLDYYLHIDLELFEDRHSYQETFEELLDCISSGRDAVIEYLWCIAKNYGYDLTECLGLAYDTIKVRTGKTVNGTFIKD